MFGNLIPWKKKSTALKDWDEDNPVAQLRRDFDLIWDRFWDDWQGRGLWDDGAGFGTSLIKVEDNENDYVLRAELPGFEPEEIDVNLSGNVLTLRAEHTEEGKKENGNFRRYGSFCESFTLPDGVLTDKIDARYHSGVLELHVPKSEEGKAKRIEVKPT